MTTEERRVCVTGGSGFIGSWLVNFLLDKGYTVHATVKNLQDEGETKHLRELPGAASRLRLFQIDLLDYDSLLAAIRDTAGVFHLASPCILDRIVDPERELLEPAVKGTINTLRAAKESGVRRVVVTSSTSAIIPNPSWPADVINDEECWTDVDHCKQNEMWYAASKTLAEKAAWEFAKQNGLDVVVINPGMVMGPILPPTLTSSMAILLRFLQGCFVEDGSFYMGCVHVKDVAAAHILLYESASALGRHLCVESIAQWSDFVAEVARLYPEYKMPRSFLKGGRTLFSSLR
uniref:Bifunctional dihydroflavonol 4-reductase/flavanone 4-reductase n=1 Tax=Anthurium amnicola TaxID=1678845 RepID=A0A1D1ZBW1_9ARAE